MRSEHPPAAACTKCGKYGSISQVNNRCSQGTGRDRCKGVFGSMMGENDWMVCLNCDGNGCGSCQNTGFLPAR
jgi:hypothetical protein